MAQGNQLAGLLGRHDAGEARDAQHVALFRVARFDQRQRRRLHLDAPAGHRHPVRGRLGTDVHHVGLALSVEMRERGSGGARDHG